VARRTRLQLPGAAYHVTSRGVRKQAIFRDDGDRSTFLNLLWTVAVRHEWTCLGFCLMTTHYHLLVRTPNADLAAGMQRLNSNFAQEFNRKHGETGHVFERRYHSVPIERDGHLVELYRYIAMNPVRAGLCNRPEDWKWSSYRAVVGLASPPDFLAADWALPYFGRHRTRARERLRAFVEDAETDVTLLSRGLTPYGQTPQGQAALSRYSNGKRLSRKASSEP
jgi:putative transposase